MTRFWNVSAAFCLALFLAPGAMSEKFRADIEGMPCSLNLILNGMGRVDIRRSSIKCQTFQRISVKAAVVINDKTGNVIELELIASRRKTRLISATLRPRQDQEKIKTGVLITGGSEASTELFLPGTGKTCRLQSLPDKRVYPSIDSLAGRVIVCGGWSHQTSCLEFLPTSSSGSWAYYATLAEGRYAHTTHVHQEDLLLLGGQFSPGTTEILGKGPKYILQQDTSHACSIPDQSSTILTGGYNKGSGFLRTVARYNIQGYVENLPDLAIARGYHFCGYYTVNGNKVMVVAGGHNGEELVSTEVLTPEATSWTTGESLPRTLGWAGSLNMGSYLLTIGGVSCGTNRGEILKFNGSWTEVGIMETASYGAVATKIEIQIDTQLDITKCQ